MQMVSTARSEEVALEGFPFQLLPTHDSTWTPEHAKVTLNARLDGRLVPSPASPGGTELLITTSSFCFDSRPSESGIEGPHWQQGRSKSLVPCVSYCTCVSACVMHVDLLISLLHVVMQHAKADPCLQG